MIGNFATLTLLTKNSFLDEINKQYVITARAKGLSKNRVLYGHVFRNAMLIIIAGFPAAFIGMFFTGSLLIEVIFLDGLGLLSFEAAINRDYPVVFGTLFLFTLLGLVVKLIGDLTYTLVDPRIDFESRRPEMQLSPSISAGWHCSRHTSVAGGRCGFSSRCSCSASARRSSPTTSRSWCATTANGFSRCSSAT